MNFIKKTISKYLLKKRANDEFFNKILKDALAQRSSESVIAALNHIYQELYFFDFSKKKIISEKIKKNKTKIFVKQVVDVTRQPNSKEKLNNFLNILKKLPMFFSRKKRNYVFKKREKI